MHWPRHISSLRAFGVTTHGIWTDHEPDAHRLIPLISYPDGADPTEVTTAYMASPEFAQDSAATFAARSEGVLTFELDSSSSCPPRLAAEVMRTARLLLVPLRVEHADEMAAVLDDPGLHVFIGGTPQTLAQLRSRYIRLAVGHSADGKQSWLNWIVRDQVTGDAVGTVQATLHADGELIAELAWVIGSSYQRRGFAKEGASKVLAWLRDRGVRVFVAHVHAKHSGSIAVARSLGLVATNTSIDGETRWELQEH